MKFRTTLLQSGKSAVGIQVPDEVVSSLGAAPSAREACRSAGVTEAELPAYAAALETLAASQMICARVSS